MDDLALGAENLAWFVAATAGRKGTVAEVRGGLAVAGPVAVVNGFVDGAVQIDASSSPTDFLDDVAAVYSDQARAFVLWVPVSNQALADEAARRGGESDADRAPAMVIRAPIDHPSDLQVTTVTDDDEGAVFADLAERGYGMPGMAWLMTTHDYFRSPGCTWAIVSDDSGPLGVAAGYVNTTTAGATTGGIYYVATPDEHRGRGVAATATAWVTNRLFEAGAGIVVLQASAAGFPIYQRLGFDVYDIYQRFTFPGRPTQHDHASMIRPA